MQTRLLDYFRNQISDNYKILEVPQNINYSSINLVEYKNLNNPNNSVLKELIIPVNKNKYECFCYTLDANNISPPLETINSKISEEKIYPFFKNTFCASSDAIIILKEKKGGNIFFFYCEMRSSSGQQHEVLKKHMQMYYVNKNIVDLFITDSLLKGNKLKQKEIDIFHIMLYFYVGKNGKEKHAYSDKLYEYDIENLEGVRPSDIKYFKHCKGNIKIKDLENNLGKHKVKETFFGKIILKVKEYDDMKIKFNTI